MHHPDGQMPPGLPLDPRRQRGSHHLTQHFAGHLDAPLGPTPLLRFEGDQILRQFRRHRITIEVNQPPPTQLGPVTGIKILGDRVTGPSTGIQQGRAPPDPRRAIEIEKQPRRRPGGLLDHKMSIEKHRLESGE